MKNSHARIFPILFWRSLIGVGTIVLFLTAARVSHASTGTVSISAPQPGTTVAVGTTVTFTVTSTGFIGPTYFLSDAFMEGSLGNYDLNSLGQFSWTPAPNDVGTHNIAITATDNSGDTGSATIVLNVVSAGSDVTTPTTSVITPATTVVTTTPVATPVTTTTTASPIPEFTEDMSIGSSDSQVTQLQQLLTAQGDLTAPITGYYGSLTQAAVMKFQSAHTIEPLGIVGPETLAALNAIVNQENASASTTVPATAPTTVPVPSVTAATTSPTLAGIQSEIQSISSSLSQVESQLSQLVGT